MFKTFAVLFVASLLMFGMAFAVSGASSIDQKGALNSKIVVNDKLTTELLRIQADLMSGTVAQCPLPVKTVDMFENFYPGSIYQASEIPTLEQAAARD